MNPEHVWPECSGQGRANKTTRRGIAMKLDLILDRVDMADIMTNRHASDAA